MADSNLMEGRDAIPGGSFGEGSNPPDIGSDKRDRVGEYLKLVIIAASTWAAAVLLSFLARTVPGFAESYASVIYPLFIRTVGRIIGLLPFSVAEVLLYILVIYVIDLIIRCVSRLFLGRFSFDAAVVFIVRLAAATGIIALVFTVFCGINYHRNTFARNAGLTAAPSSVVELAALYVSLADDINEDANSVVRDGEGIFDIGMSLKECNKACVTAMKELGQQMSSLGGFYPQPKSVMAWQLLSYQNVTGVYSPFTVEANYNGNIPAFTLPFTICHELSHLKGYMREDEANFIGWLSCASSDEAWLRYSGNLTAFITVGNALYEADSEAWSQVWTQLCPSAKADIQSNNDYWKRFEGKAAETHERVNNAYLKANGQSDGVKSYGKMVDLMLAWRRKSAGA